MKNFWMLITIVGLIIVLVVSLLDGCHQRQQSELLSRQLRDNTITSQKIDDLGRQVTTSTTNYITSKELRNSSDTIISTLRDQMIGPVRTLAQATRIIASKVDTLVVPVRDTTIIIDGKPQQGYTFNYSSEWMPRLHGTLTEDHLDLDYAIRSDFRLEYHWKRTRLFAPRELELLVRSNDPNVTVGQIQNFTVHDPTPWYGRPLPVGVASFLVGGLVVGILKNNVSIAF